MFLRHRTQAIVLKKENIGEADENLWVFTEGYGLIKLFAKSIKKMDSKLRSQVQVFYLVEIEFIEGKIKKRLIDATLIDKFSGIRKDLLKIRLAYSFAKVFRLLTKIQESDKKLWRLLRNFFENLNQEQLSREQSLLFYYYFLWNFLRILGYRPELGACLVCRKRIDFSSPVFWQEKEGGLVCQDCLAKTGTKPEKANSETIRFLQNIITQEWEAVRKMSFSRLVIKDLKQISQNYLFNHLSHR